MNWADQPDGVKKDIWGLVAILAEYGPGRPGVPLDLMDTEQPTKWRRQVIGREYVVLINTSDKPINVVVSVEEIPQLAATRELADLFTNQQFTHPGGPLNITLNAYDSACLSIT